MKNHLYFLPSQDVGGKKKTFLFFEYTHNWNLKSDQLENGNRATAIIENALTTSTRNIAIDTSTNSGRNLLHRILPVLDTETTKRIYLASVFRQRYMNIRAYGETWETVEPKQRSSRDKHLVGLFNTPRTQGGMRPLTALDKLVIAAWATKKTEEISEAVSEDLSKHPAAMLLIHMLEEMHGDMSLPERVREILTNVVHCFCLLQQDPFPLGTETEIFDTAYLRLFEMYSPNQAMRSWSPANTVSYVCRDTASHKVKRLRPILWQLLTNIREFFHILSRGAPIDTCAYCFKRSHDFEHCVLQLFNLMLHMWAEILLPQHCENDALNLVDHEVFVDHKAPAMLARLKKIVKECRGTLC
jgi:hypothetical protein